MRHVSETVFLVLFTISFVEVEELDWCVKQVTFTSKLTFKENSYITQFTDDMMSVDKPQPVVSTVMLTSTQTVTFTPSCSIPIMSTTSASGDSSCSVTTVVTPSCTAQRFGPQFLGTIFIVEDKLYYHNFAVFYCLGASPVNTTPGSSSPLPWVGGGIIGAVLSTAILLTVLAAVCLLRRKRTHSQHKM